jgi:hypothetical protein
LEKNNASTALIQLEISSEPGVDPNYDMQNIDGSRDTRENDSGLGLGPDTDSTASGKNNWIFFSSDLGQREQVSNVYVPALPV